MGLCVSMQFNSKSHGLAQPVRNPKKAGKWYTVGAFECLWNRDLSLHVFPTLSFSLPKKGTVDPAFSLRMKMQKSLKKRVLLLVHWTFLS